MPPRKHILLIGNGCNLPADFLRPLAGQADLIVAADGGADRALAAGVSPHLIMGDLDSASPRARARLSRAKWQFVDNQQNTDLEKALDFIAATYPQARVVLVGFDGGRLDFELGNFLSLYPYRRRLTLCVAGPGWKIYPCNTSLTLHTTPGKRLSLLPLKPCRNVSLSGLKFPLKNATLTWKTAGHTLSNLTTAKRARITCTGGYLLVYIED